MFVTTQNFFADRAAFGLGLGLGLGFAFDYSEVTLTLAWALPSTIPK